MALNGPKMVLTLLIIGAICGGLLSGVNAVTTPIIEERRYTEFIQALEDFFPEKAGYESHEIGDEEFHTIYDGDDDFLGVVAQVEARGYGGEILYDLAIDTDGDIVGMRVVSHEETPGIGDVIETEDFQQRIIGLNADDPIELNEDVDVITGSTTSMEGMVDSVRRVADIIEEEYL